MTKMRNRTIGWIAVLALAVLALPAVAPAQEEGTQEPETRRIEVTILGMSCPFCAYGVEQKLKKLDGVQDLRVDLKSGVATVELAEGADLSNEILRKMVEDAGFEVAGIERGFESEHPDVEPEGQDERGR